MSSENQERGAGNRFSGAEAVSYLDFMLPPNKPTGLGEGEVVRYIMIQYEILGEGNIFLSK